MPAGRWPEWLLALTIAWLVTACILLFGSRLSRFLGQRGLIAMERLMGMVLVAVALNGLPSAAMQLAAAQPAAGQPACDLTADGCELVLGTTSTAALIDPDNFDKRRAVSVAEIADKLGFDCVFVGGSTKGHASPACATSYAMRRGS